MDAGSRATVTVVATAVNMRSQAMPILCAFDHVPSVSKLTR